MVFTNVRQINTHHLKDL